MNPDVALLLAQDGLTNGAIYALLALGLVLVFAVTRILFIPQGDIVALSALTIATVQAGVLPGTVWMLLGLGVAAGVAEVAGALRAGRTLRLARLAGLHIVYPLAAAALCSAVDLKALPLALQALLTVALIVPMGPMIYRLAYQPAAAASTLTLLIISVAVHFVLVGLTLFFFGAEGLRIPAFSDATFELASVPIAAQTLWVLGSSAVLIIALYTFFERTIDGKALRAAAFHREGARLMGISPTRAGRLAFLLATLIGTVSGILVAPVTTIYYDTGFLILLKGFVGAILGGLVSYPLAAAGAVFVGLVESGASFWASAFKEVIVFTLIIPVLMWLSLKPHPEEEEAAEE